MRRRLCDLGCGEIFRFKNSLTECAVVEIQSTKVLFVQLDNMVTRSAKPYLYVQVSPYDLGFQQSLF